MPRNYFADPYESGMAAFDNAYERTQAIGDRFTTSKAGRKLAAGDRKGAAETFAQGGMIDRSRQMTADQQAMDDRAAEEEAASREAEAAQVKQRVEILMGVARKLQTVPAGQRRATLERAMPLFQMTGMDTNLFSGLTEDQLTDDALEAFTGEVAKVAEEYTLAPGARRYRGNELIAENPTQGKPIAVREGTTLLDPTTRQPIYSKPKTYAPKAAGRAAKAGAPAASGPRPTGRHF